MPTVSNPMLCRLAAAARKEWDAQQGRHHDTDYPITADNVRMIGWVNSPAQNALLNLMFIHSDKVLCTYMQVRRGGLATRAVTKTVLTSDRARWRGVYEEVPC